MKMVAMSAATVATVLLMSTSPAAAQVSPKPQTTEQQAPDPDGVCFFAISEGISVLRKHPEALGSSFQSMSDELNIAFGFYLGKLIARYKQPELDGVLAAVSADMAKRPSPERHRLGGECLDRMRGEMRTISSKD